MSAIWLSPYIFCFSPIFSQQEDKSELWGATPDFLPWLSPQTCKGLITSNFTDHSDVECSHTRAIRLLLPATSVIPGFFRFKAGCRIPSVVPVSKPTFLMVIPTLWASIAAPWRTVLFETSSSAPCVFLDGFRLVSDHRWPENSLFHQVSLLKSTESTARLEVLTHFVHRGDRRHDSNIELSMFVSDVRTISYADWMDSGGIALFPKIFSGFYVFLHITSPDFGKCLYIFQRIHGSVPAYKIRRIIFIIYPMSNISAVRFIIKIRCSYNVRQPCVISLPEVKAVLVITITARVFRVINHWTCFGQITW